MSGEIRPATSQSFASSAMRENHALRREPAHEATRNRLLGVSTQGPREGGIAGHLSCQRRPEEDSLPPLEPTQLPAGVPHANPEKEWQARASCSRLRLVDRWIGALSSRVVPGPRNYRSVCRRTFFGTSMLAIPCREGGGRS